MYTNPLKKSPMRGGKSDAGGPEKQLILFVWPYILGLWGAVGTVSFVWARRMAQITNFDRETFDSRPRIKVMAL